MTAVATPDVPMPRLSDSMEEGTIVRWLKAPGDAVAAGEPLVEIQTDKADVVFEADVAGTLLEHCVPEGATAPVGATIARIGAPGEAPAGRARVSPVARRLAADLGVDVAALAGSGPGGRVVKADVEAAASASPPPAPPAAAAPDPADPADPRPAGKGARPPIPPTPLQRTVARRMAASTATVPHFHLRAEIDMTRCRDARADIQAAGGTPPPYTALIVKACALALRAHPRANGSWTDDGIELHDRVNVGVAVAADDALLVPTVLDADRKGLATIAHETAALADRVRAGAISPAELEHGTFTVSNLGMHGVGEFAAVINPPQAAILAVGAIEERPVGRAGQLVVAPIMRATLACDHRILYGADGAAFLADVRRLLEAPLGLAG